MEAVAKSMRQSRMRSLTDVHFHGNSSSDIKKFVSQLNVAFSLLRHTPAFDIERIIQRTVDALFACHVVKVFDPWAAVE